MSGDGSVGVAVVGSGGAASDLCEATDQVEGVHLVAAYDTDPERALALAHPRGATAALSLDEVLSNPDVDVVYVGIPHSALAHVAEQALLHGKHVLVEKPMGLTVDQIVELGRLGRERSLRVGGMFVLRQSAAIRIARDVVREGAIGDVTQVRIQTVVDKPQQYWSAGPAQATGTSWRSSIAEAGGGILLMNSLHAIDAVRFITGLEFTDAVGQVATATPGIEVEDSAAAAFRLSNHSLCSLSAAAHSAGAHQQERIEIDGSAGRIDVVDSPHRDRVQLYLRRPWGGHPAGEHITVSDSPRGLYRETLAAFVESLTAGAGAVVTAEDAAAALAVVQAAYRSAHSGRRENIPPVEYVL